LIPELNSATATEIKGGRKTILSPGRIVFLVTTDTAIIQALTIEH
jgi:hypothetical protein